jgi:hypothetical protein
MSSVDDLIVRAEENKKKMGDFADLIDSIDSVDEKRKFLWKEIYQNSVTDRENSYALFINLYQTMGGTSSEHLTVGTMLTKYLERMSKANDQLLKLAEIIKSSSDESKLTPDEIFDKISGG